jgi:hypothetical protein
MQELRLLRKWKIEVKSMSPWVINENAWETGGMTAFFVNVGTSWTFFESSMSQPICTQ